ncbi:LOW QUALITY PROTEIN: aldehyde dehydrogenase, partial [Streptomyces griseoflavus Tu4000]
MGAAPLLRTHVRPSVSDHPPELQVRNPATEEVIATVPAATPADVDAAVVRAARAQTAWAALAPGDRARLLRRFAAAVDEHTEELALLEVREAGHTLGNARWEAGNVRDLLDYAAGGVERLTGRQIPVPGGVNVTFLEPLGVVGVIAPWNFPMPIAAWGAAPALAAGNAVLLKPAETTPLTALRLAGLALEAGLPEGLFQVLPGHGPVAGNALVEHPDVAKIVFTESTAVGKRVWARGADRLKRVTLELGGKSKQNSLRRRRSGGRRGGRPHVLPRQRRPGLLRPHPRPRRTLRVRQVPGPPRPRRRVRQGRRPGRRERPDGPADLPHPAGPGPLVRHRRPRRDPRQGPRRPRLLVPAHRPHRRRPPRTGGRRGGLRPRRRGPPLRRRGRRRTPGQRHRLRPVGLRLDPGRRPRPAPYPGRPGGQPVRQLPLQRALLDPLRRVQAVRRRPRAGPGRAGRLHRNQERLHQHGGL